MIGEAASPFLATHVTPSLTKNSNWQALEPSACRSITELYLSKNIRGPDLALDGEAPLESC
jgi:hypothetical protein